jgi:hypothetical protein
VGGKQEGSILPTPAVAIKFVSKISHEKVLGTLIAFFFAE